VSRRRDRIAAAAPALIFVCTTCARDARGAGVSAGRALAEALQRASEEALGGTLAVREVACLNGCRNPCNVALRGAARWTYRFSHCTLPDVDALLGVAARYWRAVAGELPEAALPGSLKDKLSACTPPPQGPRASS